MSSSQGPARSLVAFAAGLLFAVGLVVGGMTQPAKVFNFLDITGNWDPSLAFVMGGALLVYAITFRLILRRPTPILAEQFLVPNRRDITPQLLIGAGLFGVGWSIGGFCPGPAITALGSGMQSAFIFLPAMAAGMLLEAFVSGRFKPSEPPAQVGDEPSNDQAAA